MMRRMRWRSDAAGGWAELGPCSRLLHRCPQHLRQLCRWCQPLLSRNTSLQAAIFCAGQPQSAHCHGDHALCKAKCDLQNVPVK